MNFFFSDSGLELVMADNICGPRHAGRIELFNGATSQGVIVG
jgi:hypothetical protein